MDLEETKETMKEKFKKLGGEQIADVGAYIRDYLKVYPQTSIYVGTDSISKRGKVNYATVIALYDEIRKDGVHYIFKRDKEIGKVDIFSRMWREVEKSIEVAEYLEIELDGHLKRHTIEDLMVMKNPAGGYYKVNQNKLCVIDVDINTDPGGGKNKSYVAYEAAKGWLVGLGYRARFKQENSSPWAANVCADLVCKSMGPRRERKLKKNLRNAA